MAPRTPKRGPPAWVQGDTTTDHKHGEPANCPDCGQPIHLAKWVGIDLRLTPNQLPITTPATGAMEYHPAPVNEWCGVFAGQRTWRETRGHHECLPGTPPGWTTPATGKHKKEQPT
jgi:hypothetical protein